MEFTTKELAVLNRIIILALRREEIEFGEVLESVYQKIAQEICEREMKETE